MKHLFPLVLSVVFVSLKLGHNPSEALVRAALLDQQQKNIPPDNTTAITVVFEEDVWLVEAAKQVPTFTAETARSWLNFF